MGDRAALEVWGHDNAGVLLTLPTPSRSISSKVVVAAPGAGARGFPRLARGVVMAMSPYIRRIGFVVGALVILAASLTAQRRTGGSEGCHGENWGSDREGYCEV